mgnify:CR=1 FL=1
MILPGMKRRAADMSSIDHWLAKSTTGALSPSIVISILLWLSTIELRTSMLSERIVIRLSERRQMTVLFAAFAAVLGMLALNRLPQPYHPVFNVPEFELASRNRFFLMILSRDPRFDLAGTRGFLEGLAPLSVSDVPH